MRRAKFAILLLLLLLSCSVVATGCGKRSVEAKLLARVGDIDITVGDFNKRISHLPERYREVIKKRKMEFLQDIINDVLLYEESKRRRLDKTRDVKETVEEARKKILIARLVQDDVENAVKITDEDVQREYNGNQAAYMMPELLRVSHILVRTREEALDVLKDLEKGASFDETARKRSFDPTAQDGGDIGYFPRGQLMPEFENACVLLKVGEVSEPVKTKLGYHVIKLTDKREPVARPLDEVIDRVKANLIREKRREKFDTLLKDLRDSTKIEISEKALNESGNCQ